MAKELEVEYTVTVTRKMHVANDGISGENDVKGHFSKTPEEMAPTFDSKNELITFMAVVEAGAVASIISGLSIKYGLSREIFIDLVKAELKYIKEAK